MFQRHLLLCVIIMTKNMERLSSVKCKVFFVHTLKDLENSAKSFASNLIKIPKTFKNLTDFDKQHFFSVIISLKLRMLQQRTDLASSPMMIDANSVGFAPTSSSLVRQRNFYD